MTSRILALSLALALSGAPSVAAAAAPPVGTQAPGYYRWTLGAFEITALNDGAGFLAMDTLLHGAKPGEIAKAYKRDYLPLPVRTSRNQFLINTGKQLVLVDAGGGDSFDLHEGRLRENLAAAGYKPEQIDIVVFTHLHGDHIGGLLRDGRIAFPNATIRLDKREADYWLTPANEAAAPDGAKGGFRTARAAFAPYLASGQVKPFDGATEIAPGIHAVPAYGHTPGHTFYRVESEGQTLVVWGDVVHAEPVQFLDPAVTIAFDSDEPLARKVRQAAFADAVKQGYWVAGDHLPFPGTGHLRASGKAYVFVPINWTLNN